MTDEFHNALEGRDYVPAGTYPAYIRSVQHSNHKTRKPLTATVVISHGDYAGIELANCPLQSLGSEDIYISAPLRLQITRIMDSHPDNTFSWRTNIASCTTER